MNDESSQSTSTRTPAEEAWQLRLFSKSLKKKLKLQLLTRQIGDASNLSCTLITNGDNNGALSYHLRKLGGHWQWIENEIDRISEIEDLLGETVLHGNSRHLPIGDSALDIVVSVDVHEHLDECHSYNRELARIVRPGGRVIVTTPNGDRRKPVVALKRLLGMSIETYGHKVLGYTIAQHEEMLEAVGLQPVASGSYSKFFTELVELVLNFAYLRLSRTNSSSRDVNPAISPTSSEQFRDVSQHFRLLSIVYPLLLTASKLDVLLHFTTGYAVSVVARRPG